MKLNEQKIRELLADAACAGRNGSFGNLARLMRVSRTVLSMRIRAIREGHEPTPQIAGEIKAGLEKILGRKIKWTEIKENDNGSNA